MQNDYIISDEEIELIPAVNRLMDQYDIIVHVRKLHKTTSNNDGDGCEIHNGILIESDNYILNIYDSDSAFYKEMDKKTTLHPLLVKQNCREVFICGNYLDTTVLSTAIDAVQLGYRCCVILTATNCSNKTRMPNVIEYLERLGVNTI